MNRKNAILILKHRKEFETTAANNYNLFNIMINENLCPDNRKIFNRCYRLKKENFIDFVGTYNGSVIIQKIGDDESIMIEHFDDIEDCIFDDDDDNWTYDHENGTFIGADNFSPFLSDDIDFSIDDKINSDSQLNHSLLQFGE